MANDIAWAQPSSYNPSEQSTLAAQLRTKPFFEKWGIDFNTGFAATYAAVELRNLFITGNIREGQIAALTKKRFPKGEVEIKTNLETGSLKSGKNYAIATFDFKKDGKRIKALLLKDYDDLNSQDMEELKRFEIKNETDVDHLSYPGLEGVWFINPISASIQPTIAIQTTEKDEAREMSRQNALKILKELQQTLKTPVFTSIFLELSYSESDFEERLATACKKLESHESGATHILSHLYVSVSSMVEERTRRIRSQLSKSTADTKISPFREEALAGFWNEMMGKYWQLMEETARAEKTDLFRSIDIAAVSRIPFPRGIGGLSDDVVDQKIKELIKHNDEVFDLSDKVTEIVYEDGQLREYEIVYDENDKLNAYKHREILNILSEHDESLVRDALKEAEIPLKDIRIGIIPSGNAAIIEGMKMEDSSIIHAGGRIWLPRDLAEYLLNNPWDEEGILLSDIFEHEHQHQLEPSVDIHARDPDGYKKLTQRVNWARRRLQQQLAASEEDNRFVTIPKGEVEDFNTILSLEEFSPPEPFCHITAGEARLMLLYLAWKNPGTYNNLLLTSAYPNIEQRLTYGQFKDFLEQTKGLDSQGVFHVIDLYLDVDAFTKAAHDYINYRKKQDPSFEDEFMAISIWQNLQGWYAASRSKLRSKLLWHNELVIPHEISPGQTSQAYRPHRLTEVQILASGKVLRPVTPMVGIVPTVFYEIDASGNIIQDKVFASLPPLKGKVERDGVVFSRSDWGGIVITNNTKSSIIVAEEADQPESAEEPPHRSSRPTKAEPRASAFKLPSTYQECISLSENGRGFNNSQVIQFIDAARKLIEDGRIPSAELKHLKEALEHNLNIAERQITDTEVHDAWLMFIQSGKSAADNLALASNQSQLLNAWGSLLMLDLAGEDLNEFLDTNRYGNESTRYVDFTTIVSQHKEELRQISGYIDSHSQATTTEEVDDNAAAILVKLNNEHTEDSTMKLELFDAKTIIANAIKQLGQIPAPKPGEVKNDTVRGFADFYPILSNNNVQALTADRTVYVTVDFTEPVNKDHIRLIARCWDPTGNKSPEDIEVTHVNDYGSSHRFKFILPEGAKEYTLEAYSHPNSPWHWMGWNVRIASGEEAKKIQLQQAVKSRITETAKRLKSKIDVIKRLNHFPDSEISELENILNYIPNIPIEFGTSEAFGVVPKHDRMSLQEVKFIANAKILSEFNDLDLEGALLHESIHLLDRQCKFTMESYHLANNLPEKVSVIFKENEEAQERRKGYSRAIFLAMTNELEAYLIQLRYLVASGVTDLKSYFEKRREDTKEPESKRVYDGLEYIFDSGNRIKMPGFMRGAVIKSGICSDFYRILRALFLYEAGYKTDASAWNILSLHWSSDELEAKFDAWLMETFLKDYLKLTPFTRESFLQDNSLPTTSAKPATTPSQEVKLAENNARDLLALIKNVDFRVSIKQSGLAQSDLEVFESMLNQLDNVIATYFQEGHALKGNMQFLSDNAWEVFRDNGTLIMRLHSNPLASPFFVAFGKFYSAFLELLNSLNAAKKEMEPPTPPLGGMANISDVERWIQQANEGSEGALVSLIAQVQADMPERRPQQISDIASRLVGDAQRKFLENATSYTLTYDIGNGSRVIINYKIHARSLKTEQEVSGILLEWLKMPETVNKLLDIKETTFFTNPDNPNTQSEWLREHNKAPDGWYIGLGPFTNGKYRFGMGDTSGAEHAVGHIVYEPLSAPGGTATPQQPTIASSGAPSRRSTQGEGIVKLRQKLTARTLSAQEEIDVALNKTDADRIHAENLQNTPTIANNTIRCDIITDSIIPEAQRSILTNVEFDMRRKDYNEKMVRLTEDGTGDFVDKVRAKIQKVLDYYRTEYGDDFKNYTFEFGIACPGTKDVKSILGSNLAKELGVDIKAMAFERCKEPVQVEGIMRAMRALHTNNIASLRSAFESLANRKLTEEELRITNISEFVITIAFILPPMRQVDYAHIMEMNHIIRKYIKTAA